MLLGIISDVHEEPESLKLTLEHLHDMRVHAIYCCGDVAGFGCRLSETIDLLVKNNVSCVKGNHDRWERNRHQWLFDLPGSLCATLQGFRIVVAHGAPGNDMELLYVNHVDSTVASHYLGDADILIVGHTHYPAEIVVSPNRRILNPGSVMRDLKHGVPTSQTFATLEIPSLKFEVFDVTSGTKKEDWSKKNV